MNREPVSRIRFAACRPSTRGAAPVTGLRGRHAGRRIMGVAVLILTGQLAATALGAACPGEGEGAPQIANEPLTLSPPSPRRGPHRRDAGRPHSSPTGRATPFASLAGCPTRCSSSARKTGRRLTARRHRTSTRSRSSRNRLSSAGSAAFAATWPSRRARSRSGCWRHSIGSSPSRRCGPMCVR